MFKLHRRNQSLGLIFLVLLFNIALGQDSIEGPITVCDAGEYKAGVAVRLFKQEKARKANTSVFEVEYDGFPSDAKDAFQSALDTWSTVLISRVPIKVKASWVSITATTLATSGAKKVFKNFSDKVPREVWYPSSLANAISGKDLDEKEIDIVINVNKNVSWSYKTDGSRDNFKYDLKTVILHEIAHGLGFSTSFKIAGTNETQIQWGLDTLPLVYDIYIQNSKGEILTNDTKFGNPSAELKSNTTNGNSFYKVNRGEYAVDPPKLFAPGTFRSGGSLSHLDESKYPKGTDNAMMSPNIGSGEVNHLVGPVIKAILEQIGWPIAGLSVITGTEKPKDSYVVFPNPSFSSLYLKTTASAPSGLSYSIYNSIGLLIQKGDLGSILEIPLSKLAAGRYQLVLSDGFKSAFIKY